MQRPPEAACLAIADITGYTGYLAGVELDHAQDILADLTDTVVRALRPTFRLAKLEGDAAFVYVVAETIDGSVLQDTIEATFFAFRRRLRDIRHGSHCECNACILIPNLDLKFVVHHGAVVRQRMAGRDELVGSDVIVVHRLLKNTVQEDTGIRAYALYTQQCVDAMGVDPAGQGLREHREAIDIIGEVTTWIRDLEEAWRAGQERQRVEIRPEDAYVVIAGETNAPPQLAWEYLTSPIRRPQWGPGVTRVIEFAPTGRRGPGTTNHCMHGREAVLEEVIDYRPYDYWTVRSTIPMPGAPKLTFTEAVVPLPNGGSRIEARLAPPKRRERAAFERLIAAAEPMFREAAEAVVVALDDEMARRAAESVEEEALPVSGGRHLAEPVVGRRLS